MVGGAEAEVLSYSTLQILLLFYMVIGASASPFATRRLGLKDDELLPVQCLKLTQPLDIGDLWHMRQE